MDKKELLKAFFAGVFSISPLAGFNSSFKPVNIDIPEAKKISPIQVKLRPVLEDVGACFDEAGKQIRKAMDEV